MKAHLIADLHLRSSPSRPPQATRLLELWARAAPDDLLIVAGDLCDDGAEAQYDLAAQVLAPWSGRIILAPGNHDAGLQGLLWLTSSWRRWGRLCSRVGSRTVTRAGASLVVSLDSTLHTPWPGDLAQGRIGRAQLRRLPAWGRLARAEGRRLILVCHHTPLDGDRALELVDRGELIAAAQAAGAAQLLVGHEHRERRETIGGLEVVSVGAWRDGAPAMEVDL